MPDLTLQDYRQAARERGYRVIERPGEQGPILNLLSRVCHPEGDDPYGVWVKEHKGRATAYCHKCPHPQGDRNVRAALGLPAWEERIHIPETPGATFPGRPGRRDQGKAVFGDPYGPPELRGETAPGPAAGGDPDPYRSSRLAARLWRQSKAIPEHPQSPPRRWLTARNLWWPGLPLPDTLRWISREALAAIHRRADPRQQSGGALILLLARPEAWQNAWPELPLPAAVQCLYINGRGEPAGLYPEDNPKTLNKRNYGPSQGLYGLFGVPNLKGAVLVTEGAADGLALASRQPAPVLIANGVSGLKQEALRNWLQGAAAVQIYADQDAAGAQDAQTLGQHLTLERVPNTVIVMPPGLKDPAAASAAAPPRPRLNPQALAQARQELQEADPELPFAEVSRQAALRLTLTAEPDGEHTGAAAPAADTNPEPVPTPAAELEPNPDPEAGEAAPARAEAAAARSEAAAAPPAATEPAVHAEPTADAKPATAAEQPAGTEPTTNTEPITAAEQTAAAEPATDQEPAAAQAASFSIENMDPETAAAYALLQKAMQAPAEPAAA